jgi:hypothetical protein
MEAILQRQRTGTRESIAFRLPASLVDVWADLIRKNPSDRFLVKITRARNPRSTGDKSQNHHINGHVQQIAQETGNDYEDVKNEAKMLAIKYGYPFDTLPNGWTVPKSEADLDTVQAGYLIEALHEIAAFANITLRED